MGTSSLDQASDSDRYQAIVAEIYSEVERFAPPLLAVARPFFERLAQGEFSQVAALLPAWLADLAPVDPIISHRLGVAHLYGWWYYAVQDDLLDGSTAAAALLGGHLALLKMVETYRALGLADSPCWADFERLALTSAEQYALELQTRFATLAELTPERLALVTIEFIMGRGAPFYFNTLAQLHLAGFAPDSPLRHDLLAALRCFTAARQIGDDAGDWLADLRAGQLNYVSARMILDMYARGLISSATGLDLERLIGYQIGAEEFWAEIERTHQQLCQEALDRLGHYGESRIGTLIQRQMATDAKHWATGRAYRATVRELF